MTEKNGEKQWTINIANHSDQVAFFIRPQLMQHAEEVMPSFWSAGYFTLAPSESVALTVNAPAGLVDENSAGISISGWNVEKQSLSLKP